jgi:hypothetical protein
MVVRNGYFQRVTSYFSTICELCDWLVTDLGGNWDFFLLIGITESIDITELLTYILYDKP